MNWQKDIALAEAVNGEVFFDNYGEFTKIRENLRCMPKDIRLKRLAGNLLVMAQSGQYNFVRCMKHGEPEAAQLACVDFVNASMKVCFLLQDRYLPYYKWSFRALRGLEGAKMLAEKLSFLLFGDNRDNTVARKKYDLIEDIASKIISLSEETEEKSELMATLRKAAPHVENARYTDSTKEKMTELNHVILSLWPYIREELDRLSEDASKGPGNGTDESAGSNGPTEEQINEVLKQLKEAAQRAPQTSTPKGRSSKRARADVKTAKDSQSSQMSSASPLLTGDESKKAIADQLGQMLGAIAADKAESSLEKEQEDEIGRDAMNVLSATSSHRDVPVSVTRKIGITDADKTLYKKAMEDIGPYSKRLQKQMLEIMRDLKQGGIAKHKSFGKVICPNDAYRADERFFANKKAPVDLPNMAVSVLVDHSGSMSGQRITESMNAAILLHDFATGIGIPVAVSGHRTVGREVEYIVYADYDRYGKKDAIRLAQMSASGCNRDGAAIEIAAARLNARPETLKLLIVISDGRPNHGEYGGMAAMDDIRDIVSRYRRKGVEIIGAAIGSDREIISEIYGDGFLDISDLSRLPKTLTKLVERKLLNQIR